MPFRFFKPQHSLRSKIIISFVVMILMMSIGTSVTLVTLYQATQTTTKVNEIHHPAAYNSLELLETMNRLTSMVNDYLLTGDKTFKSQAYALKDHIVVTLAQSHHHFMTQHTQDHAVEKQISDYLDLIDTLFKYRDSQMENYPGLALAIELTDPHTMAYLGIINEVINSELEDVSPAKKTETLRILNELRYSWLQMNNAFRIFISTRADNDIANFYSYSARNGELHKQLRDLGVEIGLGLLEDLESHRTIRMENVPKVVKVFQSQGWRQDVYILKTQVYPLLKQISATLEQHSQVHVTTATTKSNELTGLISKTSITISSILFIALLLSLLVAYVVQKSVKPLFELEKHIKERTFKTPMFLNQQFLSLPNEIGTLARTFDKMNTNMIEDLYKLHKAEDKFEILLYTLPTATVVVDDMGMIRLFNRQAELLFGYLESDLKGKPFATLMPDKVRPNIDGLITHILNNENEHLTINNEYFGLRQNGSEFQMHIDFSPIDLKDDLMVSASIRDITEHKLAEQRLIHQANYDSLTELPNRTLVMDRLTQAITLAKRNQHCVAVMFIDLDQFKHVNDTLGHSVGDKLLCSVAERLLKCVRSVDTVSRLGGDEFLVILPDIETLKDTEVTAERIISHLSRPYSIDNRELYISASIGITGFPNDTDEPEVLFRNADAAMYYAKNAGRNTFRFFTEKMNNQLVKRLEIESQLRKAIQNNELYLVYQPQYDLSTNTLVGAEALLRWDNPIIGLIDTEEFISIAEETGLIDSIGDWVLTQACRSISRWQPLSKQGIRVSVNISALQFRAGDLVQKIKTILHDTKLPAHLLELEITESILVEDNPNTSCILDDIKRLGPRLSLDDFGKGYSSLSYLKRFPFDVLKIDRSFISDLNVDRESTLLCKAISAMANSLQLDVIAEGVETPDQLRTIHEMGITLAQGHLLGKPVGASEFETLLKRPTLIRIQ